VTDIDLSHPARRLGYVRFAEYFIIFYGLIQGVQMLLYALLFPRLDAGTRFLLLLIFGPMTAIGVVAYADSGRLRPRIWRRYRFLLPIAAALMGVIGLDTLSRVPLVRDDTAQVQLVMNAMYFFVGSLAALLGTVGLFRLTRARLEPAGPTIGEIVATMEALRGREAPPKSLGKPINRRRGLAYVAGGVAAVAAAYVPKGPLALVDAIWTLVAFVLLLRARRYFQVSADSLLAADRRQPILFLRSFADDALASPTEMPQFGAAGQAVKLIDYSIETRLANHFMDFGPFIAVGSPRDTVPEIGAARVRLSEAEWQTAVSGWIDTASVLVMFPGTTEWVAWELAKVIAGHHAAKLILLFPRPHPVRGVMRPRARRARQEAMLVDRLERTRAAFAGTAWEGAWKTIAAPHTVIAVRLQPSGEILVFRSDRRSNDAYQLAAEMSHLDLLGRLPVASQRG
jgi:hypothetical protein